MKKVLLPLLLSSFMAHAYALPADSSAEQHGMKNHPSQLALAEKNKKIVTDFYHGVFIKHQVKAYSDRYLAERYIQHNPYVPDGKAPFVNYFVEHFKQHPKAQNVIKRAIAENDLVVLHVHSTLNEQDRGKAIVDIFRVDNGKIVEHWDVQQEIPNTSANQNTMF